MHYYVDHSIRLGIERFRLL